MTTILRSIASVVFILSVALLCGASAKTALPTGDSPCNPNSYTVVDQPEVLVRLTIHDYTCTGTMWKATIGIENAGSKAIRSYDVVNVEDYEHKHDVWSSQGGGVSLAPGGRFEIEMGGGFPSGKSYGKPTGNLLSNRFSIGELAFDDGTVWKAKTDGE